jgi:hypothetical protein
MQKSALSFIICIVNIHCFRFQYLEASSVLVLIVKIFAKYSIALQFFTGIEPREGCLGSLVLYQLSFPSPFTVSTHNLFLLFPEA